MKPIRPTFRNPPLVEQAITVIFEPIAGFTLGDFGLFWDLIRSEFPHCTSQEPLPRQVEAFEPEPFQIQLATELPLPRALLRNDNSAELVQVQHDRFSFNWMLTEGQAYPSHDKTVARFWQLFSQFRTFLRGRGLAMPSIIQCDLTNVNIINDGAFAGPLGSKASAFGVSIPSIDLCPQLEIEAAQLATHYVLRSSSGNAIGRVHAAVQPVLAVANSMPAIRFDLTARGRPQSGTDEGIVAFFDDARSAINSVFLAYTTDIAKAHWGETQ